MQEKKIINTLQSLDIAYNSAAGIGSALFAQHDILSDPSQSQAVLTQGSSALLLQISNAQLS